MKEFKVLTQKDRFLSKKFNPEMLERALNSYAEEGWNVRTLTTAEFPGFIGGKREELIVILEREK